MRSSRLLIGGAAATAAVGVRVARSLYGRWRVLPEPGRGRIAELAEDAKEKALSLRGAPGQERAAAEGELRSANETLAAAIVETAEADPEIPAEEVDALRDDLRRELERLATADVKISRGPGTAAPADEVKRSGTRRGPGTPPG
jgi:hypothetical protein